MSASTPKTFAGLDGAALIAWLRGVAEELLSPFRHLTIDFSRKEGPVAQSERFEALKSVAASGHAGCMAARKRLKRATNAGLARALGRDLPPILSNTESAR